MMKPAIKKFWSMANTGDEEAEIIMYGEIMEQIPRNWLTGEVKQGMYITPEGFREDLAKIKGKSKISIRINSFGGDLFTGMGIYNQLKSLPAKKTVIIDGIAASAASLIAMAGDSIDTPPGGTIMMHDAAVMLSDYYNPKELEAVMKSLDAINNAAAQVYSERTKIDVEEIRAMMAETTWLVGEEAIEKGFADRIYEGASADISMSMDKNYLFSNGLKFSMSGLKNIPEFIKPQANTAGESLENPKQKKQGGKKILETVEELKREYPILVNALITEEIGTKKAEIIKAERQRLMEIDEIAKNVVNTQLVYDAKFGENPCTASELALNLMKLQAKEGEIFLAKRKSDFEDSGAAGVAAASFSGEGSENNDAEKIKSIVNLYEQSRKGVDVLAKNA